MTGVRTQDVSLPDGRTLRAYDTGGGPQDARRAVVWHHGTPNIGSPPEPLFATADRLDLRWIGYDRPGYGGSTPAPGRSVASAARDTLAVADALGVSRFGVMGHSGGGPHALACAALLGERVVGAVAISGMAPYDAADLDWFAGMGPGGEATLRAAVAGREVKEMHEARTAEHGEAPDFTPADWAALEGPWSWLGTVVGPAMRDGPGPLIDDDLAYVAPWGFDPARVRVPTFLLHGADDRIVPAAHAGWLASRIPDAELRILPGEGHVSVLREAEAPLAWLAAIGASEG